MTNKHSTFVDCYFKVPEACLYFSKMEQEPLLPTTSRNTIETVEPFLGESIIISFISLICCCVTLPISLSSVYFSSRIEWLVSNDKIEKARGYRKIAQILGVISLLLTVMLTIFLLWFFSGPIAL